MNQYVSGAPHHHTQVAGDYITHGRERGIVPVAVRARAILDSRGWPTVEVAIETDEEQIHIGSAPAGASTGSHEARELRDGGPAYSGRGVAKAVAAVNTGIAHALVGHGFADIRALDSVLRELDGTSSFASVGANAAIATSIAASRAFAHAADVDLWMWVAGQLDTAPIMPVPHFNVLNGGAHAANDLDFQEFMIAPVGAATEEQAVAIGAEVYHALADLVRRRYGAVGLGDEGGFAPPISDPREALDLLVEALDAAGADTSLAQIALDPAANGFRTPASYRLAGRDLDADALVDYYRDLIDTYPIRSIEDGLAEDDAQGWKAITATLGDRIQIVGDDLFVTDPARIAAGAEQHLATAALIKPNQIGTVSDTFDALRGARSHGLGAMVSHRSGETLDTFIADLAVGAGVGQIKSGAPARGERIAKYNRLTEIAQKEPALPYGLL